MTYRLELRPSARKELRKLPHSVYDHAVAGINGLAQNPRPFGVKKLAGYQNRHRIRVGDYRIIYEIHDDVLLVLVVRVAHRREAY
jgi:mRNA interferase RelE/StbE